MIDGQVVFDMAPKKLDATGLKCPLPVLKAQKALREMASGEILEVMATDKNAPRDLEDLCGMTADHFLESREEEGVFFLVVRKG